MEELRDMMGFAPYRYYYYSWLYITPLVLLSLLVTTTINMVLSSPGYDAWIKDKVKYKIRKFLSFAFFTVYFTI